jgi:hypothetical protein
MQNLIMWRDINDSNYYHFGVKDPYNKPCLWFSMFIDGIFDMFGKEFSDKIDKKLKPGIVYNISEFTIKIDI